MILAKTFPKAVSLKNLSVFLLSFFLLFMTAASSSATFIDSGDLEVYFHINSDNSGFFFEGLTLDLNAGFGAKDGVKGEFKFGSSGVDTVAYYYINDVIRKDQLQIGRFCIDWASASSVTLNGSLAQNLQWRGGVATPRDAGFDKGIGAKYKTDFEKFSLVASVSNSTFGDGTDLAARASIPINPDLQVGVGVASINRNRATDASDFGLLLDAGYRTGQLHLLCEVININSRWPGNTRSDLGFYVEAAYELKKESLLYGGFCGGSEDFIDNTLIAGYKTRITPHTAVQGEILNSQGDWGLTLGLKVNF
jgi:hypothetical protein